MNNIEKIDDFVAHMPIHITKRQKNDLLKTIYNEINQNKDVTITISQDYTVLTATVKEGATTKTYTVDVKQMIPKKKNKFIEWLNN